jgi:putative transposase
MSQAINHYAHCVYRLDYHLVLVTKYRRKALNGLMIERLRTLAKERCEAWRGQLLEMDGEADHVHLLISMPPTAEPARFVNNLKTTTSRLLRRDFPDHLTSIYRKPVLWSASYFIASCGGAPLETIKQYIQQQDTPE